MHRQFDATSTIAEVFSDPAFQNYGRLLFPLDKRYMRGTTLGNLRLAWYSHIDPAKTVEIINYLKIRADNGEPVFFDIYTNKEKEEDPDKNDTGLFFFKGKPNGRFAVCVAGGGFAYVGAIHDSFPVALELSKAGYNAFGLIYRPAPMSACEDLSRALRFIFEHAWELEVNTCCYSLWGGSAGGRIAAWVGSYGPAKFGAKGIRQPCAVIIQYSSLDDYTLNDPPTFACVGDMDEISSWQSMQQRMDAMSRAGIETEFHVYKGLEHGFGLGTGTPAEGWLRLAIAFWEKQKETEMKKVLILAGSPRKNGNSAALCNEFARGATESGNQAELIYLADKNIGYCHACYYCQKHDGECAIKDDMAEILAKMNDADVIVMASPVYFYAIDAQMKALIDRVVAQWLKIKNKTFYYIMTAAEDTDTVMDCTLECMRGLAKCLEGSTEGGVIYGKGVYKAGEIKDKPAMNEAYEMGKNV